MLKRWLTQDLTVLSMDGGQSLSWPALLECRVIDDYSLFLPLEFQLVFLSLSDGLLQYAPHRPIEMLQEIRALGVWVLPRNYQHVEHQRTKEAEPPRKGEMGVY